MMGQELSEADETVCMLTLCFLHEAGHLFAKITGELPPVDALTNLELGDSEAKRVELRADRFAGEQLADALASVDNEARRYPALQAWSSLLTVSTTLVVNRLEAYLNGLTVSNAVSYLDSDATFAHPNLHLRYLVIRYYAAPSTEAESCIRDYLALRELARKEQIHDAVRSHDVHKVEVLLRDNPTLITLEDRIAETPMFIAASGGDCDMMRFLLAHGADVNDATSEGATALHAAARESQGAALELLLARGADVHARTWNGVTPILCAASDCFIEGLGMLIRHGAGVSDIGPSGLTPLHVVANDGCAQGVGELLLGGADIDATDSEGRTPLMLAIMKRQRDVSEVLLRRGATVNARDYVGYTALHHAAGCGLSDMARVLLAYGADVQASDYWGNVPWQVAVSEGHADTAKLLMPED